MKVSHLTPYCTTAGINGWLTNLIAGTRHKVGWSTWYESGQYVAQRYMRALCDINFSHNPAQYLEMYMPDIIHTSEHPHIVGAALTHKKKYNTPIVLTAHCRCQAERPYVDAFSSVDVVVLPSEDMYENVDKWGSLDNHRMVYHGVIDYSHLDITPFDFREEFDIPADHMVVGCVSRIASDKNWDALLRLADRLREYPIAIVLVGTGMPRHETMAMHEIAKKPNLHYANGITPLSMPAFYRGIDCGLSVSPYESFGLAICEMCWSSLPVVAVRGGGVEEILGEIGIVRDKATQLVNGLVEMLDADKRKKMGQSLRRRVIAKRLSARRMGEEYISIYNELLGQADATD